LSVDSIAGNVRFGVTRCCRGLSNYTPPKWSQKETRTRSHQCAIRI